MTNQELTIIEGTYELVPSEVAHDRLTELREFCQRELKEGLDGDYAVIPGTGSKPSLLQPGAEKVCEKLGVAVTFPETRWVIEDHSRGAYMADAHCVLIYIRNGRNVGECWGSGARDAKEELDASNEYRRGQGKELRALTMRDKGLARNTALKMAQKSALVGATLRAGRLGIVYTQDVEDGSHEGKQNRPAATTAPCPKHPGEMLRQFEKDGKTWWAHKTPDGKWCNATPATPQATLVPKPAPPMKETRQEAAPSVHDRASGEPPANTGKDKLADALDAQYPSNAEAAEELFGEDKSVDFSLMMESDFKAFARGYGLDTSKKVCARLGVVGWQDVANIGWGTAASQIADMQPTPN